MTDQILDDDSPEKLVDDRPEKLFFEISKVKNP